MVRIITDDMLAVQNLMPHAIAAIEGALMSRAAGRLVSPPRHHVGFQPDGDLVFTIGGTAGDQGRVGFRVYHTFGGVDSQLVAVWSPSDGNLAGLFVGHLLGDIRTGAIGGVAVRHMSRTSARSIAVIGSGHQARTQLAAAAAVRPLDRGRVYSPNPERRAAFASDMTAQTGIAIVPTTSAREAVEDADIVICATDSPVPVIEAAWLKPGVHVTTVGPKSIDAHEVGTDIAAMAALIATDAPEQTQAYRRPFFLEGVDAANRMVDLSDLVAGGGPERGENDVTLFCSAGLAGTEVLVAARLLEIMAD